MVPSSQLQIQPDCGRGYKWTRFHGMAASPPLPSLTPLQRGAGWGGLVPPPPSFFSLGSICRGWRSAPNSHWRGWATVLTRLTSYQSRGGPCPQLQLSRTGRPGGPLQPPRGCRPPGHERTLAPCAVLGGDWDFQNHWIFLFEWLSPSPTRDFRCRCFEGIFFIRSFRYFLVLGFKISPPWTQTKKRRAQRSEYDPQPQGNTDRTHCSEWQCSRVFFYALHWSLFSGGEATKTSVE